MNQNDDNSITNIITTEEFMVFVQFILLKYANVAYSLLMRWGE